MNAKTSFLIVSFLALAFNGFSQTSFSLGFTAGANYASLKSDLFPTVQGRPGFAGGFTAVLGINDRFELVQEVAFVQKGATAEVMSLDFEAGTRMVNRDFFYNGVELSVLAGVKPFASVPVYLHGGVFAGTHFHHMEAGSQYEYVGGYQDFNEAVSAFKLNEAFSGTDFGAAAGFTVGEGSVRLGVRYYLGMRNLYNSLDFVQSGPSIRSNSMRLSLMYFLN